MRRLPRCLPVLVAFGAVVACSDAAPDPVTPNAHTARPSSDMSLTTDVWNMADLEADFGGLYSLDTTQVGMDASFYVAPVDPYTGDRGFCRDHFNAIDLWWDGGYGLMRFHLDPPLLFVAYRTGTYTSPRRLVFRRAIYETIQSSEATDPAGNVWRFTGRYNALYRGGELELGPVVFGAQVVVAHVPASSRIPPLTPCEAPVVFPRQLAAAGGVPMRMVSRGALGFGAGGGGGAGSTGRPRSGGSGRGCGSCTGGCCTGGCCTGGCGCTGGGCGCG